LSPFKSKVIFGFRLHIVPEGGRHNV